MPTSRTRSWRAYKPAAAQVSVAIGAAPLPDARVLGLDPGSRHTGFGIIDCRGSETVHVASGAISTAAGTFPLRLQEIFARVSALVAEYRPVEIAVERVFVQRNVDSALKLGQARGAALCGVFAARVEVFEYAPREVKMAVVGAGGADKQQVQHMVRALLQLSGRLNADAADALAVALCHAHGRKMRRLLMQADARQ